MRIVSQLARIIFRLFAIFGMAAFVATALLLDFLNRSRAVEPPADLPPVAVVFTGDFDRIHMGLELLSAGRVEQLFITGVNGDAGLDVARFATQFNLTPEEAGWIESGKISLAPDALTTFENAMETGCWLDRQPERVDAVALITSRMHMARASIALQHEIWPRNVVRIVSDPEEAYDFMKLDLRDFAEYVATWSITFLPHGLWPGDVPSLCHISPPPAEE